MSSGPAVRGAPRVALIGRGALGEEVLERIQERRLGLGELRVFATDESAGDVVDFFDDEIPVEKVDAARVAECDLVICAAPGALAPLLPALRERGTRVIDLSGAIEEDPSVPLALPGFVPAALDQVALIAVPRGVASALGLALQPLAATGRIERVTLTTLEPAAGVGRAGIGELAEQTVKLLNGMTGEAEPPEAFPQALAFDCLPLVGGDGRRGPGIETSGEDELREVLFRLIGAEPEIEITRIRVPIFMGTLAAVHVALDPMPDAARVAALYQGQACLEPIEPPGYPTPRSSVGSDRVQLGRLRVGADSLGFVIAQDDLRRAALTAVELAEALFA